MACHSWVGSRENEGFSHLPPGGFWSVITSYSLALHSRFNSLFYLVLSPFFYNFIFYFLSGIPFVSYLILIMLTREACIYYIVEKLYLRGWWTRGKQQSRNSPERETFLVVNLKWGNQREKHIFVVDVCVLKPQQPIGCSLKAHTYMYIHTPHMQNLFLQHLS